MAKSIGALNRIEPPQSEMKKQVRMITDGMEMIIVVVWKNVATLVPSYDARFGQFPATERQ